MACFQHSLVGIFSREERSTYEWLIRTVTCSRGVKDVRPVLITNKKADFEKEIPKCTAAILYHSKTRGRLNVTDVTDSLYDEELKALYEAYGRGNVIVVIGDLEDNSNERMSSILQEQPSIGNYTSGLFLFNEIKSNRAPFQGQNMKEMKTFIEKMALRDFCKKSLIWLISVAAIVLIVIIVMGVRASHHPEIPITSPPPPSVTNITSDFISSITPTPSSAIDNITSDFISSITPTPSSAIDNITSDFISSITPTPSSTIDNITSDFISSMTPTPSPAIDNITSDFISSMTPTPSSAIDNITSDFISSMTPTPSSAIDNITSNFTSLMENATIQLPDNVTANVTLEANDG